MISGRLETLIEKFGYYVDTCYEREMDFPKSSYYFHKRVIECIRSHEYRDLLMDNYFIELVYATLSTWGLDRMDGAARLVDFVDFKNGINNNLPILVELSRFKLNSISDEEKERIKNKLSNVYKNMIVMKSRPKLVGISKTLHHLLPDLVPPMDRKYTLKFFYGRTDYNEEVGMLKFLEIFDAFYEICKISHLSEKDLKREWDTSIPKLIDNAIIGYMSKELAGAHLPSKDTSSIGELEKEKTSVIADNPSNSNIKLSTDTGMLDNKRIFRDFIAMTNFVAGEGIVEESTESWQKERKKAKEKYSHIFGLENLQNLTIGDFQSFLYFKNNRAWTNLYRRGLEASQNIEDLRRTLAFLQDESIDIRNRMNGILKGGSYHIHGFGKNLGTGILNICDKEDKYGVWNNRTEGGLEKLGLHEFRSFQFS